MDLHFNLKSFFSAVILISNGQSNNNDKHNHFFFRLTSVYVQTYGILKDAWYSIDNIV